MLPLKWSYIFVMLCIAFAFCSENSNAETSRLRVLVEKIVTENRMIIGQLQRQGQMLKEQGTSIADLETTVADLTMKLATSDQRAEACLRKMATEAQTFDWNDKQEVITEEQASNIFPEGSGNGLEENEDTQTIRIGVRDAATTMRKTGVNRKRHNFGCTEVAFSAGVSRNIKAAPGQVILFEKILAIVDNTYSPNTYSETTGTFIAPLYGVYVFSVTMLGSKDASGHFSFYKNNAPVSVLAINGGASQTWDSAAQTILLLLKRGDSVTVRKSDDRSVNIAGQYKSQPHSVFSGFLLYQHEVHSNIFG